jgi:polyhydroxyalkanoate synthesis regulator phasin
MLAQLGDARTQKGRSMGFTGKCRLVATIQGTLQDRTTRAKESAQEEAAELEGLIRFLRTNVVAVSMVEIHAPEIVQPLDSATALLEAFADHFITWNARPSKGVLEQFGAARDFASYASRLHQAHLALWETLGSLFTQLLDRSELYLHELDDHFGSTGKKEMAANRRRTIATTLRRLEKLKKSALSGDALKGVFAICQTVHELQYLAQVSVLDWKKCWTGVSGKVRKRRERIQTAQATLARHSPEFWGEVPRELHTAAALVNAATAAFREQLSNEQWEDLELTYENIELAIGDLDSLLKVIEVRSSNALSTRQAKNRRPVGQPLAHPPAPRPVATRSRVQPQRKEKPPSAKPAAGKPALPAKPAASKPAPPPPAKVDAATMERLQALSHRVNKIVRAFDIKGWGAIDDAKDFVEGCKQLIQSNTDAITQNQIARQLEHIATWCAIMEAAIAQNSVTLAEQVDSIAIADGFQEAADSY